MYIDRWWWHPCKNHSKLTDLVNNLTIDEITENKFFHYYDKFIHLIQIKIDAIAEHIGGYFEN